MLAVTSDKPWEMSRDDEKRLSLWGLEFCPVIARRWGRETVTPLVFQ